MSEPAQSSNTLHATESGLPEFDVLFVDLDGSLIKSDQLLESLLRAIQQDPQVLVRIPRWLLAGRAVLKSRLAEYPLAEADGLPYREEVLSLLQRLKQEKCRLVLATASHRRIAEQIADHLELFDDVLATDQSRNLKGRHKLEAIEEYCREHGLEKYAYLGDSFADMPIWERASKVFAVAPSRRLRKRLSRLDRRVEFLGTSQASWKDYLRAFRPHQWSKNLLVFAPTFLAHEFSPIRLFFVLLAFISFSLCASAVYLINDLLDLQSDRRHPVKRNRPFASGKIPGQVGVFAVPGLLLAGVALALVIGGAVSADTGALSRGQRDVLFVAEAPGFG